MNARQSSHDTCTRVATDGVVAADVAVMELPEQGRNRPSPREYGLGPPRDDERGGGAALQWRQVPTTVSSSSSSSMPFCLSIVNR